MPRRFLKPFEEFFKNEAASGIILLIFTVIALFMANSLFSTKYEDLLHHYVTIGYGKLALSKSVLHWINDGLMAIFFLLVGMEIKRELITGELKSLKNAILPVTAAIGGMLLPALIYYIFNYNSSTVSGWGIPMATDIAFALGILSLVGNKKAPKGLAVFLTALAIIDDLGAIVVIAIFYTEKIFISALLGALVVLILLFLANRFKVKTLSIFLILGLILWLLLLKSGLHATIAGVLLGMTIPINKNHDKSMLHRLEHSLTRWVSFGIMPIFALANAGVSIDVSQIANIIKTPLSVGVIAGLVLGKQLGVFGTSYLMIKLKWANIPSGVNMRQIYGASVLSGIGFTMSLFIATLSFENAAFLMVSKISIIIASFVSAVGGLLVLTLQQPKKVKATS